MMGLKASRPRACLLRASIALLATAAPEFMCTSAVAIEVSCEESRIAIDRRAYPVEVDFSCAREEITAAEAAATEKMRVEHPETWNALHEFGEAFSPENAIIDSVEMSSSLGTYGFGFLVTAKSRTKLKEPNIRKAIVFT